jgi:hypothetical protein
MEAAKAPAPPERPDAPRELLPWPSIPPTPQPTPSPRPGRMSGRTAVALLLLGMGLGLGASSLVGGVHFPTVSLPSR